MRRADRYQQLMRIARQLVSQEGADALTMTALSELAGVAKPVVYSHFSNSSDVIVELLNTHFQQLVAAVNVQVQKADTLEEYVSAMVDASFDFENASDLPIRKITNGFSADERVNEAYLRHEEEFIRHWELLLRACGTDSKEVGLAAYAILTMMANTTYTFSLKPRQRLARETTKKLILAMIASVAPDASVKFDPQSFRVKALKMREETAAEA
jgi:AcrR family transcriptional regulator